MARKERQQILPDSSVFAVTQDGPTETNGKESGVGRSGVRSVVEKARLVLHVPKVGVPQGRDIGVDALRGFAILLVVLGHSISNAENLYRATKYDSLYYLSNFVYTFHMPLFMLIGGYVLFGKRIRVWDRAVRLLLPFFAWIPVNWFVNRYIHHFPWSVKFLPTLKQTVLEPGLGLWFLPTLFLCSMLLIPVLHLEKWRSWTGDLTLALFFISLNLIPYDKLGLMQVKYFFFYFAVGYLAAKYRPRIKQLRKERVDTAFFAFSIVFLALFTILYYYGRIDPYAFPFSLSNLLKTPAAYFIRYLMGLLGIVFSVALIRSLKTGHARTAFAWFGLVTMEIYVSHGLMLQLTFGGTWLKVLVSMVTGVVLPLALAFLVLRPWWLTAVIFLGIEPARRTPPVKQPPIHQKADT
jgi:fucose 4-O-acetylase-like acetyltransferase